MKTTTNDLAAFQVGRTYSTPSVCDHECIFSITVESRTACFITTTEGKRLKVSEWKGAEQVSPLGSYSMAPIIGADDQTEASVAFWMRFASSSWTDYAEISLPRGDLK